MTPPLKRMGVAITTLSFLMVTWSIPEISLAETVPASTLTSKPASPSSANPALKNSKKLTLKEKIALRRQQMRERLKKKRLEKSKSQKTAETPTIATKSPSSFDEFQIPELNDDKYEIEPPPVIGVTPSSATIPGNVFDGIQLSENIPAIFYKDEIFTIGGTANSTSDKSTLFAFLNYTAADASEHFLNYETKTQNTSFAIPIFFNQPGNYFLGMVLGSNGKSKVREIQVKEMPKSTETTNITGIDYGLTLTYDDTTDKTQVNWKRNGDDVFYRITFAQNAEKVSYITRQNVSGLPVQFYDYRKFKPGNIALSLATRSKNLEHGWQTVATTTLPIAYHGFRTVETENIKPETQIPGIVKTLSPIVIEGSNAQNIQNEGYITNPGGLIEKVTLTTSATLIKTTAHSLIPKNSNFEFKYTPPKPGRYIVEINKEDGSALINVPIYVQTGIPLIPDYQDKEAVLKTKKPVVKLPNDQVEMLKLINIIREGHGKKPVILDAQLNALAQAHADDMVKRDFFGHINPDGLSPHDRRKKSQIPTEVGENLAYSGSVLSAIQGLLRSPIHRANILMDDWVSVGIGITKDANDYLKVAQEFSPPALTNTRLAELKNEMLAGINNARQKLGLSSLQSDATLEQVATSWSQKLAATDEFGLTMKDGNKLSNEIEKAGIQSSAQLFVFSSNTSKDILDRILEPSSAAEGKWQRIGLGMAGTSLGEIKITILLIQ